MAGTKRIEYRSWRPPDDLLGERLAIHASKLVDDEARLVLARRKLPLVAGCVLGHVLLAGVKGEPGDWRWILADPVPLRRPVRASGQQKLWHWD
jgi:hypothetical protein